VSERGSLEPSRIDEAYSQVEGRVTVVSLLPDGSRVKAGDTVCELDSASFKESLVNQTIARKSAEAAYENAKLARELAEIALTEYVEGILKQDRATLKNEIGVAEKNMQQANDRLERIRGIRNRVKDIVARKGAAAGASDLVAELDIDEHLEAAGQTLDRERSTLEQAKSKLERFEKYTSKKMIAIETDRACREEDCPQMRSGSTLPNYVHRIARRLAQQDAPDFLGGFRPQLDVTFDAVKGRVRRQQNVGMLS
jgi:hypothetical protein